MSRKAAATRIFLLALVLGGSSPSPAAAQERAPTVSLAAGVAQYDLSGVGTAPVLAVRAAWQVASVLVMEPGLTYVPYRAQFGSRVHHVMPELHFHVQYPGAVVRPYIGGGVGASWSRWPGMNFFDPTVSVAGGARVRLAEGWTATGELRVRAIDPWSASTADWTLGIGRRF